MDYLVAMTTAIPAGAQDGVVDDLRTCEADRADELAAEGRLLRLWCAPSQPGQWRSVGLFTATDQHELETMLASTPGEIWRIDEITPLDRHPQDPTPGRIAVGPVGAEFLTTLIVDVPEGTAADVVTDVYARERERSRALAGEGKLLRLWRLPGERRALSYWQVADADELAQILGSLPMAGWLTQETVAVTPHPKDPALPSLRDRER